MTNLELSFCIFFFLGLTAYFIAKAFKKPQKLYTRNQVEKAIIQAKIDNTMIILDCYYLSEGTTEDLNLYISRLLDQLKQLEDENT
jgi:hypothetical protein